MPISTNDPFYQAEFVPGTIDDMGPKLRAAYGVGPDAFGAKGNVNHDSGYHRSRKWVLLSADSRYGPDDYSVQTSADHGGSENAISAFDFTPGVWGTQDNRNKMITITKRVRDAARANDPRLANLREFAGTEDGTHVVTFYAQGGANKTPFDSSHLDHGHGSLWRNKNENNHQGIVDVMLGVPAEGDEEMSFAGLHIGPAETNCAVPGGNLWKPTWLVVTNDTHGENYALRIWTSKGDKNWTPIDPDGLVIFESGLLRSFPLPENTRSISIERQAIETATNNVVPVLDPSDPNYTPRTVYTKDLSFCLER